MLRGESTGETVAVRTRTPPADAWVETDTQLPEFKPGGRALLFLFRPSYGGGYNTRGDYYYVLGLSQGVYFVNGDGTYAESWGSRVLERRTLSQALEAAPPVDKEYFRKEFIENQKRNLENGFNTQEEYDRMMGELDVYAEIVE